MRLNRVLPLVGGVVGAAALVALSATPGAAATTAQGAAGAVYLNANVLGLASVDIPGIEHAEYPATAVAPAEAALVKANVLGLVKAKVLAVESKVMDGKVHSHSDLTDVQINLGLLVPGIPVIKASALNADAWASATAAGVDQPAVTAASSNILKLQIGSQVETLTANQPLDLSSVTGLITNLTAGAVTITFDKQVWNADHTGLTVDALDINIGGGLLDQVANTLKLPLLSQQATHVDLSVSRAQAIAGAIAGGGSGGGTTTSTAASTPAPSTTPASGSSGGGSLASTGVSGVVPLMVGGVALVVIGGGALYWTARRRKAATGSSDS